MQSFLLSLRIEYFKMKALKNEEFFMQNAFDIPVLNVLWTLMNGERFLSFFIQNKFNFHKVK